MPILAEMFPDIHFILIDPHPSMIVSGPYHNIQVIQGFMTDEVARKSTNSPYKDFVYQ
jgi:hypothetical protein